MSKENVLLNKLNEIYKLESHKEIEAQFDEVAKEILNNYLLKINSNKYRITEIEFYYNDECSINNHPDPYIYKDNIQQSCGKWYFHRKGRGGLDITFGKGKSYGGILLRGLQNTKAHYDYIDGPLLVSDRILEKANKINEMKKIIEKKKIFDSKNSIYLIKMKQLSKSTIYKTTRVGLHPKRNEKKWYDFIMKNYRYLIYPEKTCNGKELLILSF